jgi:hypothetical protein
MACLITQCYPPCPPVPGLIWIFHPEYVIGDAEDEEEDDRPKHPPVHAGQVAGKTDRNNVSKYLAVWSYGEYLLHENVPWEKDENRYLLEQVAECLCDEPRYRPRLNHLKIRIETSLAVNQPLWGQGNTDADTRRLVAQLFDRP